MDPRLSNGRPPGFVRMPPPGHHSGEVPQSQPRPPRPQPPHNQQQQLTAETPPPHLGPNTHPQEAAYRAKGDQPKNRSRRMKSLNLIQFASTNPVPRCRHLASQIALEEITFWTNVCNMWLLDKKQNQQLDHGEQGGGGERMMDMGSLAPDALTGQEYYYYNNDNNNSNNNNSPSYGLHGEAATTYQPARMYYNHHRSPPPPPPHPTSTTTTHSNGVEAIRAALNHNVYEDPTMPISIAATVGPPHPQTSLSAHHHNHHHHPNYPSPWMMQSQSPPPPPPPAATTRRTADYNNNPYATMPRRGGRRDWRGQVPRPAGLQTRAEREFNGVDVYGRYKPDA